MRLSFSNIAWDVAEDPAVADILRVRGFDAVDVAPGKYFPDPATARDPDVLAVRQTWMDRGFEVTGMQALLFGTTGLNVFGPAPVQDAMLRHLAAVCRIGRLLGAPRLVFGSPKNRDRSGIADAAVHGMAVEFFRRLGEIASSEGVRVALEPNPREYGANFMTTSVETAAMVRAVDHPAIGMQFDTGAITMNGEDPEQVLSSCAASIIHVHASEPGLVPLGDGGTAHGQMHAALMRHVPQAIVTVEMVATAKEPHLASVTRAADLAALHYGPTRQPA